MAAQVSAGICVRQKRVKDALDPMASYAVIGVGVLMTAALGFVVVSGPVLGSLNATANWRRIAEEIWPFRNGPPSTPIGEAEAAWLSKKPKEVLRIK